MDGCNAEYVVDFDVINCLRYLPYMHACLCIYAFAWLPSIFFYLSCSDSCHKLIRWWFVTHGGINGYSRLIAFL